MAHLWTGHLVTHHLKKKGDHEKRSLLGFITTTQLLSFGCNQNFESCEHISLTPDKLSFNCSFFFAKTFLQLFQYNIWTLRSFSLYNSICFVIHNIFGNKYFIVHFHCCNLYVVRPHSVYPLFMPQVILLKFQQQNCGLLCKFHISLARPSKLLEIYQIFICTKWVILDLYCNQQQRV